MLLRLPNFNEASFSGETNCIIASANESLVMLSLLDSVEVNFKRGLHMRSCTPAIARKK